MDDETITMEPTPGSLVRDLLHAMGQPLTGLQMCVLLRDHGRPTGASSDELLADMAEQVTILTRLFATLRNLLECDSPSAAITASDLWQTVHHRLARWQGEAAARGITLIVHGLASGDSRQRNLWNGGPLQTCLQDVFEAALLSSPRGGQIALELVSEVDLHGVLFRLRGGDLLSESSFSARYGLPVARALLSSPAQCCTYTTRPFEVTLKLLSPERMAEDACAPSQPRLGKEPAGGASR